MTEIKIYKCDYCDATFTVIQYCKEHEILHENNNLANSLFKNGKTLEEINNITRIWKTIPEHMKNITKDNCFIIEYLQCCGKPAYRIENINLDGSFEVGGKGSGSYICEHMYISSHYLQKSYNIKDLYIHKD